MFKNDSMTEQFTSGTSTIKDISTKKMLIKNIFNTQKLERLFIEQNLIPTWKFRFLDQYNSFWV